MEQSQQKRPRDRASRGFTLIELMVTISVAAVLLGIATPSFRDMAIRNRLSGYTNDFIATVNYARSEAVRRGAQVAICRSSDGATCSGSWSDGWIVFANLDNDSPAVIDTGGTPEPLLKVHEALGTGYTLDPDANFATSVAYGRDGAATNTGIFAVCHDGAVVGARAIVLTRLRPRVAKDTNGDRIPNRDDGANIANCSDPSS